MKSFLPTNTRRFYVSLSPEDEQKINERVKQLFGDKAKISRSGYLVKLALLDIEKNIIARGEEVHRTKWGRTLTFNQKQ